MGANSLPKTVTQQRRDCDLNQGPSAPESSTLTTRLPSHTVIVLLLLLSLLFFLLLLLLDSCYTHSRPILHMCACKKLKIIVQSYCITFYYY